MGTLLLQFQPLKSGQLNLTLDTRDGPTPETIEKVQNFVLDDRRVKMCETAETVDISEERVRKILHEELGMRKLCARRVPHLLGHHDLASSDFNPFPKPKKFVSEKRFAFNEEVEGALGVF